MQNVQLNNRMTYKLGVPLAQILMLQGLSACGGGSSEVSDDLAPELNTINGSPNADYIRGTSDADIIYGMSGNDRILSFGGDDVVYPGSGFDTVLTGDGNDIVYVSSFTQEISGGDGNDAIVLLGALQSAQLTIDFEEGLITPSGLAAPNNLIFSEIEILLQSANAQLNVIGSKTTQLVETGAGSDNVALKGSSTEVITYGGDDLVTLRDANVTLKLGDGSDVVELHNSNGVLDGGAGIDTAGFFLLDTVLAGFEVNLVNGEFGYDVEGSTSGQISAIENISVSATKGVKLIGSSSKNELIGGSGDDHIISNGGADILTGNGGDDTFQFDYEINSLTPPQIRDFASNGEQDVIEFVNTEKLDDTNGTVKLEVVTLSSGGIKASNADTNLFIFLSGDGFASNAAFEAALNGSHGLSGSSPQSTEFIALWINSASDVANVSRVMFTPENSAYDVISPILQLIDYSESQLIELTSDNFLLA
jgi:Ca2+-binding RTX toxin-like protein